MTNVIANLIVDGHPFKAKLTSFLDGHCCLIASNGSEYSLWQKMLRVLADGSTSWLHNALYDCRSSSFEIAFQGL
jgi:hypothetical protein